MFLLKLFYTPQITKPHEMSTLDHLEELRWRLIRSLIIILAFTIVAFLYMPYIFQHILFAPARTDFWTYRILCRISSGLCVDKIDFSLQSRTMSGQFSMHIIAAFITGIICSFPYIAWQVWGFLKPALYKREKTRTFKMVLVMPFLFVIGILFGYYIIAPMSINFLANYKLDPSIQNQFDITSYISTISILVLGSGLMFQLPVIIFFLTVLGIVKPQTLSRYRKHSIVAIFVVAAIITPSPDILTQMLVAIPLYVLFEISILISASTTNKIDTK